MNWIIQNMPTIIICLILIGVVSAIIFSMIKNKKQGKSSCGCNCQGCAMNGSYKKFT